MSLAKSLLAEMYGICLCLSIEATVQKLQKSFYATWRGGGEQHMGNQAFIYS
jgi:hypothetical protein